MKDRKDAILQMKRTELRRKAIKMTSDAESERLQRDFVCRARKRQLEGYNNRDIVYEQESSDDSSPPHVDSVSESIGSHMTEVSVEPSIDPDDVLTPEPSLDWSMLERDDPCLLRKWTPPPSDSEDEDNFSTMMDAVLLDAVFDNKTEDFLLQFEQGRIKLYLREQSFLMERYVVTSPENSTNGWNGLRISS